MAADSEGRGLGNEVEESHNDTSPSPGDKVVLEADRISALPEAEREAAIASAARTMEADAVPLLERLATSNEGQEIAALRALASIRATSAAEALARISETSTSGAIRKEARRGLYRLRSLGVKGEATTGTVGHAASEPRDDAYKALASPIDGAGNRGIWIVFKTGADLEFVSTLFSDEEGVKDVFVRESSPSRFQKESRRVLEDPEFPWIEIPVDYARHLLNVAHRNNAPSGTSLPLEFIAWRDRIARPKQQDQQPIIYSVMSAGEVRWEPRHLDNSGSLYELDLFRGWIFDKDEIEQFVRDRISAERTGLMLAGVGGEAREQTIEAAAIQKLFDPRRRSLIKGRLEEMSYILWKLGRLEAARSALAAALALEPLDRPLTNHPFVKEMVHWSLEIVTEMTRTEHTRAIKPGIQLHLP